MFVSAMFKISNFSTSSPTLDIIDPFYFGHSDEDVCSGISLQFYFFIAALTYIFLKKYFLNLLYADYVPSPDLVGVGLD